MPTDRQSREPGKAAVARAVAEAHRGQWAFVLAATVRVTRDLDLAEECVQDAYAKALVAWASAGIPARPGAWLTTAARNRAVDVIRRDAFFRSALPLLAADDDETVTGPADGEDIPDERLRLIFTCCHPALAPQDRVALTLRLVCGLTTAETARAFLVGETAMAARITRAKKKITAARIPYRIPDSGDLPERVDAVLTVVDLVFTTGHVAPEGPALLRTDLIARAADLARMLGDLLPGDAEVAGLRALILLTDARRPARLDTAGAPVLLADQDRGRWDRAAIAEGLVLVRRALRRRPPGPFGLRAAIAAVHAEAPSWEATDWQEIVGLYDLLLGRRPTPVAALNRAVAVGFADGPAAGLAALDGLAAEQRLAGYPYASVARGEFLHRLGRLATAGSAYREALLHTSNAVERDFLLARIDALDAEQPG
ncbi:RNA polymerase sigma factor [Streptomyces sp. NBC_01198]|uniref:RNA polymerase sigma factor n=1 Tax=Streptomyces sp. NBC_01198 TaxID=2903769 RepID=UPI002E11DADA|nr:RNA polymerase sigma factor [Streptomyces sp. NBC_01198]